MYLALLDGKDDRYTNLSYTIKMVIILGLVNVMQPKRCE